MAEPTDAEVIAAAVAEARERPLHGLTPEAHLESSIEADFDLRWSIARFLLSRDPDCVRVPMVGSVK